MVCWVCLKKSSLVLVAPSESVGSAVMDEPLRYFVHVYEMRIVVVRCRVECYIHCLSCCCPLDSVVMVI